MKIKKDLVLEFEKEGRVYRMSMPIESPLGEAYEAASGFMSELLRIINEHEEKRKKLEEKPENENNNGA